MFKIFKKVLISILLLIAAFILAVFIFIKAAPQMGQAPEGEHLELISQSTNYGESGFVNKVTTTMDMENAGGLMYEWLFTSNNRRPESALPTEFSEIKNEEDTTSWAIWYGHSTILLKLENTRILIDPVFGPSASPVPFFTKRFPNAPKFTTKDIPEADIVIISHDHYDHLDYPTMKVLAKRDVKFLVPLGVGSHLQRWGIEKERIKEMDWWESAEAFGITFHATPARHFSGRGIGDRMSTLWASWVMIGNDTRVYFSGDGGYSPDFKKIGEEFGPFDLSFVECGQYNYRWKQIHMTPEETVQAGLDLGSKTMIPIHWGAFNLAPHSWIDPAERVYAEAERQNQPLLTPRIGERILIKYSGESDPWWRSIL